MQIPFFKEMKIAAYLLKQRLAGRERYPLVLMLEPLFRCNLACVGCGKIDYPDPILNQRLSVKECLDAVDECGAPLVALPGGEPLIDKEIGQIVAGIVARKKFVSLCTNALLLEKKLHLFKPSPYLFFSIHLDGLKEHHDKSVSQAGVYDIAVSAIKAAKAAGFQVNVNATIFDGHAADDIAAFLDRTAELGVGVTISPGYAYERAPDQEHFLNRRKTKELFRSVFALGKGRKWRLTHSPLYSGLPGGQSGVSLHALGHAHAQRVWLAETLLSPRRGLRSIVQGADGDDGLGQLWHRPIRKVRKLHGPLRLRADGRPRGDRQSAQSSMDDAAGRENGGSDGAGDFARAPATRRVRVLAPCREDAGRHSAQGSRPLAARLPRRSRRPTSIDTHRVRAADRHRFIAALRPMAARGETRSRGRLRARLFAGPRNHPPTC